MCFSPFQAKDKVIASLRDGSNGEVASGISSSEYEEVCHERDMLRDEVNQFKYRMEQLKADLQVNILEPWSVNYCSCSLSSVGNFIQRTSSVDYRKSPSSCLITLARLALCSESETRDVDFWLVASLVAHLKPLYRLS